MPLYSGIDLHSNNCVVTVTDDADRVLLERRVANDLELIKGLLLPYQTELAGVVVESTFNWYWLVDGLTEAGFEVHLANTAAIQQYSGLKHTDDFTDARWLAQMLRLGVLKEGYICPKPLREVRDLLRKRGQLVGQRTSHILSVQNAVRRETGRAISTQEIKRLVRDERPWPAEAPFALAIGANLAVLRTLDAEIGRIEKAVQAKTKLRPEYRHLLSMPGVGKTLGLVIMLETGEVSRFATAGRFASYCRCVDSKRLSNGKKKGANNAKNGNRYLAWAFVEAAHFAVRYYPRVRRFYDRKKARRGGIIAIKAVAHKLARAAFYVMRDGVEFDMDRAFT